MKLIKKLLAIFAIIAAIGFMILPLTGCPDVSPDDGNKKPTVTNNGSGNEGNSEEEGGEEEEEDEEAALGYIQLTEGVWKKGNIATSDGEQWFRFTATATTQYIHFDPGTMSGAYVQLYNDSRETTVGTKTSLYSTPYTNKTVTNNTVYFIKVTPFSGSGTYQIAFNTSSTQPAFTLPTKNVTTLTENTWADGNIATSSGEQWFKFTATVTGDQYIHYNSGTMTMVYVQLYDNTGTKIKDRTLLSGNISQTVTIYNVYYIKVIPYNSGSYQIGFTTSTTKPSLVVLPTENVTTLTVNRWSDGNIADSSGVQWFKFTATATPQYIHFNPDTMERIYIQLYDTTGAAVGSRDYLYGTSYSSYASRTVTINNVYYIKVTPYSSYSGAYQIAFATSSSAPSIIDLPTENVITLTENTWSDGNIATSSGEQWFKFTATATPQYIHYNAGTMSLVYVQIYDATGTRIKDRTSLSGNISQAVTIDNVYYIKVTPYSSSYSGSYQIGFTTSTTKPSLVVLPTENVTTLTAGVWADGNIPTSSDVQWFKFTANSNPQYIHFSRNTMNSAYVQLYDNNGATVGDNNLMVSSDKKSLTVTINNVYYIKVTSFNSSYGTYQIAINTSNTPPTNTTTLPTTNITQLTAGSWYSGDISSGGEQWFRFTANANPQYIHFNQATLNNIYVQLYDATGKATSSDNMDGSMYNCITIYSLTNNSVYYIKVTANTNGNSGTYQIAVSTSTTPPNITLPSIVTISQITVGTWASGSIVTSGGEQWFVFTSNATTQYIHFSAGTLSSVFIQLYNTNGATVSTKEYLYSSSPYASKTVTNNTTYYIRVISRTGTGSYNIGVTTSYTEPQ